MEIPLLDAVDTDILMHRDIHFGGNFDIMIDYYEQEGVGAMADFEIDRIRELKVLQNNLGENLSSHVLPMPALEEIERARALYHQLREVYETPHGLPHLISDLILSEEEEPDLEIQALVARGKQAVDALIHLIDSTTFYDPLYPGYGRAPLFAAQCLGKIQDPKAIYHLFQALGQENFYIDEALIQALVAFKESSKSFLLKRILEKPFTRDNEHAAMVLTSFPPDEEIATICFSLLQDKAMWKHENFASYLICACEGLKSAGEREAFMGLMKEVPTALKAEMAPIARTWK